MERKYTMQDFEKMFLEAQKNAMSKLDKELKKVNKKETDNFGNIMFTMHNMMVISQLYNELFKNN